LLLLPLVLLLLPVALSLAAQQLHLLQQLLMPPLLMLPQSTDPLHVTKVRECHQNHVV
jgi:hypothetical protein